MVFFKKKDAERYLLSLGFTKNRGRASRSAFIPHKKYDRILFNGSSVAVISNTGKCATLRGFYEILMYEIDSLKRCKLLAMEVK